jgi:hypothetical protein
VPCGWGNPRTEGRSKDRTKPGLLNYEFLYRNESNITQLLAVLWSSRNTNEGEQVFFDLDELVCIDDLHDRRNQSWNRVLAGLEMGGQMEFPQSGRRNRANRRELNAIE